MAGNPPLSGVTRRGSSSVVTNANPPLAGASATEAAQEAARETAREAAREKAREAARETAFATVEDLERAGVKVGYSAPSEFEYSYQEIKNLVRAKDDPVFSVALEEWGRKERVLSNRVDRREKRSADLINQIFNLIGFYSVFLGVVLTAVSQLVGNDCKPQCGKIWFPILLTVVAAAVIITGVSLKFTNLKELEESIQTEKQNQKVRPFFPSTGFLACILNFSMFLL